MISPATTAYRDLCAAVATAEHVAAYQLGDAVKNPPGVIVSAPELLYAAYSLTPSTARFVVYVVVRAGDNVVPRLLDATEAVVHAIDNVEADAAILTVVPGAYGDVNPLPANEIIVEMGLSQ